MSSSFRPRVDPTTWGPTEHLRRADDDATRRRERERVRATLDAADAAAAESLRRARHDAAATTRVEREASRDARNARRRAPPLPGEEYVHLPQHGRNPSLAARATNGALARRVAQAEAAVAAAEAAASLLWKGGGERGAGGGFLGADDRRVARRQRDDRQLAPPTHRAASPKVVVHRDPDAARFATTTTRRPRTPSPPRYGAYRTTSDGYAASRREAVVCGGGGYSSHDDDDDDDDDGRRNLRPAVRGGYGAAPPNANVALARLREGRRAATTTGAGVRARRLDSNPNASPRRATVRRADVRDGGDYRLDGKTRIEIAHLREDLRVAEWDDAERLEREMRDAAAARDNLTRYGEEAPGRLTSRTRGTLAALKARRGGGGGSSNGGSRAGSVYSSYDGGEDLSDDVAEYFNRDADPARGATSRQPRFDAKKPAWNDEPFAEDARAPAWGDVNGYGNDGDEEDEPAPPFPPARQRPRPKMQPSSKMRRDKPGWNADAADSRGGFDEDAPIRRRETQTRRAASPPPPPPAAAARPVANFDDVPAVAGGGSNGDAPFNFSRMSVPDGADAGPTKLTPCATCGRKFAARALEIHTRSCGKSATRKKFDASKARAAGTEVEKFQGEAARAGRGPRGGVASKSQPRNYLKTAAKAAMGGAGGTQRRPTGGAALDISPPKPGKPVPKWKKQSEMLRAGLSGASGKGGGGGGAMTEYSAGDDLEQCPHCLRKFNETAAARHIPQCRNIQAKPTRLQKGGGRGAHHRGDENKAPKKYGRW